MLPTAWLMRSQVVIRFVFIYEISEADRTAGLQELGELLGTGALKHTIGATLPLSDIAKAHDLVEQGGVIGNVVLTIP